MFSIPLTLSSSFTVHLLDQLRSAIVSPAHPMDTHRCAFPRHIPPLYFLLFSPFFFFLYLFYFTRTYFLRGAYRASQRITFMGFPEIKRIPCRGPGAGKFRQRATYANHLESWRRKMCFGLIFNDALITIGYSYSLLKLIRDSTVSNEQGKINSRECEEQIRCFRGNDNNISKCSTHILPNLSYSFLANYFFALLFLLYSWT